MSQLFNTLYWRINDSDQVGIDVVSLLMPNVEGQSPIEYPTDVRICARQVRTAPQDIRWSDDDNELFMSLLDRLLDDEDEDTELDLDINDDVVQGIVQLVALRRFKAPLPTDELGGDTIITEREELDIGDLVALNTATGYPLAIIVGLDSIDATCVLLDTLPLGNGDAIADHTVLVINRLNVLPAAFASEDRGEGAVFH